jgi:hypothetical protein
MYPIGCVSSGEDKNHVRIGHVNQSYKSNRSWDDVAHLEEVTEDR